MLTIYILSFILSLGGMIWSTVVTEDLTLDMLFGYVVLAMIPLLNTLGTVMIAMELAESKLKTKNLGKTVILKQIKKES